MLFVSSSNNPLDFEYKGGIIALEIYKNLLKKNKNLEFIIRSNVPKWIKIKYGRLEGLKFIESFLSRKDLEELISSSSLLLEPVPGIQLLLECMKFSLPVISFDYWATPEMVIDKKSGIIIDSSKIFGNKDNIEEYIKNHNLNYLKLYKRKVSKDIINEYSKKTEELLKNKILINKMGRNAKRLTEKGNTYNFNTQLKKIKKIINSVI